MAVSDRKIEPPPPPVNGEFRVLLLEDIHAIASEIFLAAGFRVETLPGALNPQQLRAKLAGVHVLGIRSKTEITAESLAGADSLITVGAFCIGTNQIDLQAAKQRGIAVFNAPFGNTRSVAEMVISEIIMLSRRLGQRNQELHQGLWRKDSAGCYEIRGKTLGIVGYGHIGSQVSALAESLGMRVIFYDILPKLPLGNARGCGTLKEVLAHADFLTLHVPATPLTYRMIGSAELSAMKKGAFVLNSSRGTVVDVEPLAEALRAGHLAGAAIDVFPEEPNTNSERFQNVLQGLSNVVLTPHIGGATEEAQVNIGAEVPATLIRFVKTGSSAAAVNFPEVDIPPLRNSHRILNVHRNVPGVLSRINRIVADIGANIEAQSLATDAELGYLVIDTDKKLSGEVKAAIESLETSIKTRILY
jgi:D-3-phosphoglycerate dehydrogenase / 2-oxoglutarate reductase